MLCRKHLLRLAALPSAVMRGGGHVNAVGIMAVSRFSQMHNTKSSLFHTKAPSPADITLSTKSVQDMISHHPQPIRPEFHRLLPGAVTKRPGQPQIDNDADNAHRMTTKELEALEVGLNFHRKPESIGDWVALVLVKSLRVPADIFFMGKYLHRAVTLETVAAVPGMVAGMLRHLTSLRRMRHDGGWISALLHEAENERMHLMIWMRATKPTFLERMLVTTVQGVFFNVYFVLYLLFPKVAHRFVGYLEEEAVKSYSQMLQQIDSGKIKNIPAPDIAIEYYGLADTATLRDVALAVRADEANHRDVNHHFSDRLRSKQEDLRQPIPPRT